MTTGRHVVEDLHCVYCMQLVGWTYVRPAVCCAHAYVGSRTSVCLPHATHLSCFRLMLLFCHKTVSGLSTALGLTTQLLGHVCERPTRCAWPQHCLCAAQVSAEDPGQKYKEGKAILERNKVLANDLPCPVAHASITFDTDDDSSS